MTLELTATLTLIASHIVLTAIGFWIGWKLGKYTGYLEAEAELAAIASEEAENRKQSSPFTLAEPEEGEWIPWDGGERPVDGETKVDVGFRCGALSEGRSAKELWWVHGEQPKDYDITDYRLSK